MTRRCLTHPVGLNADIEFIGCPAMTNNYTVHNRIDETVGDVPN